MSASPDDMNSLIQALGANSADQEKQHNLEQQAKLAQAIRSFRQPQGHMMGQIYAAPSGLETLGSDALQLVGNQKGQDAINQMGQVAQGQQDARTKMLAAILRSKMAQQQGEGDPSQSYQDPNAIALGQQ